MIFEELPKIQTITPNGPATRTPLKVGDVIYAVNKTVIEGLNANEILVLIKQQKNSVTFEVERQIGLISDSDGTESDTTTSAMVAPSTEALDESLTSMEKSDEESETEKYEDSITSNESVPEITENPPRIEHAPAVVAAAVMVTKELSKEKSEPETENAQNLSDETKAQDHFLVITLCKTTVRITGRARKFSNFHYNLWNYIGSLFSE